MALSEYDIIYTSQKAIKGSVLAEQLAHHPLDEYQPLLHEFPNEHIMAVEEAELEFDLARWKLWFDGASNLLGNGIGALLASPRGQCFPFSTRLGFDCTNNMAEYEACTMGIIMAIELQVKALMVFGDLVLVIYQLCEEWEMHDAKLIPYHNYVMEMSEQFDKITFYYVPRDENQMADAVATLSTMLLRLMETPSTMTLRGYLEKGVYPPGATKNNKRMLRRLAAGFSLSGTIRYKRKAD
ncbi:rnhA, partial [Mucuna pruriens]